MKKVIFIFCLLLSTLAFAANEEEVDLPRTSVGARVEKNSYIDVPQDRKIVHIVNNVIRPEEPDVYVNRRMDTFEEKLEELEKRITDLEAEK